MLYNYNKKFVSFAKKLRREMTPEEKHLWYDFLKRLPVTVNRQKNIGNYIVDFFIAYKRIVIEIDGAQHKMLEEEKADRQRDQELQMLGITVLRYTNKDVNNNFNEVCNDILTHIGLSVNELNKK